MIPSLKDKRIRGVLEDAASRGDPRAVSVLSEQKAHEARRRERTKPTRQAKRRTEEAETAADAEVYKAVRRRDRGCTVQLPESIVGPCGGRIQIDHQWGRGKEETRVENCRCLCEAHHHRKTDSKPNRVVWLTDYGEHCLGLAGLGPEYFDELDRAQRMAQLEKAQHPESRSARDAGGRE